MLAVKHTLCFLNAKSVDVPGTPPTPTPFKEKLGTGTENHAGKILVFHHRAGTCTHTQSTHAHADTHTHTHAVTHIALLFLTAFVQNMWVWYHFIVLICFRKRSQYYIGWK